MRDTAEVVVIGAGIMGLSVAYNLAKLGTTHVSVLDSGYLCGGASGRNGGGIRAQWSSEASIRLMQESIELCREFAREHRINTWFRQGGYLFLARTREHEQALQHSIQLQEQCGLSTRWLEPNEIHKLVPELSLEGVSGASYNPYDAVVFPWPFVWGYAENARALGVEVCPFTRVIGIETRGRRITSVLTERGPIRTQVVVNAAGAYSPEIARHVGVDLPTYPHRHEICSSEPLKPWLTPLVADLSDGLYFSQSTRGEIVGGVGNARVPAGFDQRSSARFLALYARALMRVCPVLGAVKILRQWAGFYDISPDRNPIVGAVDAVDGFFLASGFMGHGFMMAPIIGKLLAQQIAHGTAAPVFERWNLRRFEHGDLAPGEELILG